MSVSTDRRMSNPQGSEPPVVDDARDFEPPEQGTTQENPDPPAGGDGGVGYPVPGSGPKDC